MSSGRTENPLATGAGDDSPATRLASLLEDARGGCDRSLGELTERYRRYLLLVANTEISADLRAKFAPSDLVQETFLHAGQSFDRFTGSSEQELLAWLRRILHYRAMHAARRYQQVAGRDVTRELRLLGEQDGASWGIVDSSPTPSAHILAAEDRAALDRALARLSAEHRQIILLRTLERMSFAEIGTHMQCSAEAARKRWVRAVAHLRSGWKCDD